MTNKPANKNEGRLKFRNQLAISFCVGIAILAITTSVVVSRISGETVRAQQVEQGLKIADSFAEQSKLALLYQSDELAADIAKGMAEFPGVIGIKVEAVDGTVLYQSGELSSSIKPFDTTAVDTAQLLSKDDDDHWTFVAKAVSSDLRGDDWAEIYNEEIEGPSVLGYVTISIGHQALQLMQSKILRGNLIVSLVVALVLLLFLIALSRRLTNPLEKLSRVMKKAEEGDKLVRAEIRGPIDIVNMQHAFNTMMEVLEKREAQLLLARDSALESARIKGEFAANVTHELRTPMNAVLGMMDLLLTMGLKPKQQEYVETAKLSGENLLELIDEILNFSEIDAEKIIIDPTDCYLHEMLDDVLKLLASAALKKKLDLGYILSDNVPKAAFIDNSKVNQVLINLVGNAIKFTSTGEVAVYVDCVTDEQGSAVLHFKVTDTGIGVSPKDQQRIFEAFTQADASTTREYGGTGLGLAISKQIVELMGGEIKVSSQLGLGSSFEFTVPLSQPSTSVLVTGLADNEAFGHLRVLVVDDSKIIREFAQQQLTKLNIETVCVDTGLDALKIVREQDKSLQHFDVLFVDHDMPGLQGEDFLKLVRDEKILDNTLLVFLVNPWSDVAFDGRGVVRLPKPLLSNTLYYCLHDHFFETGDSDDKQQKEQLKKAYFRAKNILVVDDNRPNQQVACGMLERLGYSAEVVSDGKQAVEAVLRNRYDAVLMDCHMPILDGYAASRQIRMYEGDGKSLPIVAMTANNSKEEMEHCLDAGMTDFLPKPLRMEDLKRILLDVIPESNDANEELESMASEQIDAYDEVSFDPQVLQALRDDVGEIVGSMIEAFLEDTPVYLQSLKNALAEADAKSVRELAHTIKGSAGNFGAHRVVAISRDLENMGASNALDEAAALLSLLLEAYDVLRKDLESQLLLDASDNSVLNSYTLLIVDDDRSMRLALKNVLGSEAYSIEEASNGMQAIAICKRKIPDLILMDAMMPEINGFVACERIRQLTGGADVPILMITALDNEESIIEAFKAGATDYIPKPVHFAVMKQRVTRLIKSSKVEKRAKELAYHDPLTGLPNRSQLMQQLRLIINRASLDKQEVAVLFLDLDRFKMINDTLGHDTGDLLLKAVADRIRRCVREQDFIARLGGDEFTVVLEGVQSRDAVARVAEKICSTLAQPFVFLQQKMFVTTSVGISIFPEHGSDMGSLLKHADTAMFRAKEKRDGYCFYENGMEDEIARQLELERELRIAIPAGELVLHIQPKMEFITGEVRSGEALVRWQHPKHGLLGPNEFIPLAEETGVINQIGNWVLDEACRLLECWQASGYDIKLAVNLSGKELLEVGLEKKFKNLFSRYNISPHSLELEITESILMENPSQNVKELRALKEMGITLAIDDFGSGFSSLNYLKRLPVDVLKIDRTFIQDIETDPDDKAIVAGIVALARSLGLKTVAEGIETEGQKEILAGLECDSFQGFLLSRPVPPDEFEKNFLANKTYC